MLETSLLLLSILVVECAFCFFFCYGKPLRPEGNGDMDDIISQRQGVFSTKCSAAKWDFLLIGEKKRVILTYNIILNLKFYITTSNYILLLSYLVCTVDSWRLLDPNLMFL
jgi:hypothetical protein